MDHTNEIPFEKLNTLQVSLLGLRMLCHWVRTTSHKTLQNPHVEHGIGRLIRGFLQIKPDVSSIHEAFNHAVRSSTDQMSAMFTLEFYPGEKVLSVTKDSTAFVRGAFSNGFAIVSWKEDSAERRMSARGFAREIADIMMVGQAQFSKNLGAHA